MRTNCRAIPTVSSISAKFSPGTPRKTGLPLTSFLIRKYLQELDRETINELIDHIEIDECTVVDGKLRQDVKVFYRFVG